MTEHSSLTISLYVELVKDMNKLLSEGHIENSEIYKLACDKEWKRMSLSDKRVAHAHFNYRVERAFGTDTAPHTKLAVAGPELSSR